MTAGPAGAAEPPVTVAPFGKRALDVVGATVGLVLLSPVIALLWLLVRVTSGRPGLFRQTRPGRRAQPFVLYKLRTMRPAPSHEAALLGDDGTRITRLGAFLRSTSLDELPELWNVLVGDMSLVGPRPLLMEYLEHYTPAQARRHAVRPGITGLAQVEGRNALSWEDKLALDVEYVDRCSLLLDLRILARTVPLVSRGTGVRADGSASAPLFTGVLAGPQDQQ